MIALLVIILIIAVLCIPGAYTNFSKFLESILWGVIMLCSLSTWVILFRESSWDNILFSLAKMVTSADPKDWLFTAFMVCLLFTFPGWILWKIGKFLGPLCFFIPALILILLSAQKLGMSGLIEWWYRDFYTLMVTSLTCLMLMALGIQDMKQKYRRSASQERGDEVTTPPSLQEQKKGDTS